MTNFVVFGPHAYVRAHGRPTEVRSEFTVTDANAPYWIRISNDGVSSAVIRLNGEVVVGPSAFSRNCESIEKRVTLLPRNSLSVELRGAPGSGLSLEIVGQDTGPPTIEVVNPTSGTLLDHANPVFEIVYSDATSGIDTGSYRLVVGGVDVTSGASVSPTGASYTPPSPLAEGASHATATVSDRAGNSRSTTVDFTVDTGPPQIRFDRPADEIPVKSATPTFDIVFSDDVSGIEETSFLLEVSGVDVTSGTSVTASGASYTPAEALPEGAVSAWVTVSDRAGNSRTATVDFTVDTVPPEIRFDAPSGGSTVRSGTPAFRVDFSDGGSGIDGASFRLELDGVDVTSSAIQHGDHATFEPAASLSDGQHSATATIADRAGNVRSAVTDFTVAQVAACSGRGRNTLFDRETARQMAQLSNVAYDPDDPEDACWVSESVILSEEGFTCRYALTETAQLVVFKDSENGDLAVAFKGSTCEDLSNCSDFVADAAVARTDWTLADGTVVPNSVHTGFYCYYQSVKSQLVATLLEQVATVADRSTARVYFTGHSLGGAQAALAALDLANVLVEQGYASDHIVLYTFGAPRAFTPSLQEYFVDEVPNHFAVADKEDLVPYVPTAHYVNLRRMMVLNSLWPEGSDVEKTRLEVGDGESYHGCSTVPPVPGPDGVRRHTREEYVTRLLPDRITDERPEISLSVNPIGNMVMRWQGDVEGACDRVALYRGNPFEGGQLTELPDWVRNDDDGARATLVPKSPLHHIAYIDGFDQVVDAVEYEPEVPASLTIEGWGANNGLLRVNWGARLGDVGPHDFVALYEHRPTSDTVHEWVLQNNVFNELNHHWSTTLSMSERDYWAAYVTSETGSALELRNHPERARILKVVKHDLPALWLAKKDEPWPLKDDLVVRWSVPADGEELNDFVAIYEHEPREGSPHDHARKHNARLDSDNKWDTNLNWEIGGLWAAYVRQPDLDLASAYVLAQVRHTPGAPQSAPSATMAPPIAGRQRTARPSSATTPGDVDPGDARSAGTVSGAAPTGFGLRAQDPVAARLTVAFSLDREGPATLDVFDIGGRQVATRRAVPTGHGWRTMQFDELPPGVYGVLLRQGGRSQSCRAVVVR